MNNRLVVERWKFFFFWEVNTCWYIDQEKEKSSKTKDKISVGTHSNQIWEEKYCLARWAKACATALPCRSTWAKEILRNEFDWDKISLMICPPQEFSISDPLNELTTDSESPSHTNWTWLDYVVKLTARRVARSSRISTDGGFTIYSDRATNTWPSQLWITTPIPALSDSLNIAPSLFVFT